MSISNMKSDLLANGLSQTPHQTKKPQAFHPFVVKVCQAIAGESYEILAGKMDDFYRRYPNQNDFIKKEWPRFFWGAINAMDGIVRGLCDDAMRAEGKTFVEILGLKETYREALEMQASIPMEGEGTMVQKRTMFN